MSGWLQRVERILNEHNYCVACLEKFQVRHDGEEMCSCTDSITVTWTTEDVKTVCPELTEDQARQVLHRVEKDHDAEHGITWEFIRSTADYMSDQFTEEKS